MKKLILALTLALFSLMASAKETWVVKEMPEVKYLFKTVAGDFNKDPKAGTAATAALVEEAKKYQLVHSKTAFFKLDFKNKSSSEVGLEVTGPNLTKVPADRLKTRAAGKFLIGHYVGKLPRLLYQSIGKEFKQKKLTSREAGAFAYQKNAGTDNGSLILLLSVK